MVSLGTQLGPYVILGRLGSGGMGEVYLARDPRLERDVALKMLPAEFALDPDRMARFRSEALALAAINHPNIATVFGFEEPSPGRHVLVMERVEGESLAERLRGGALPPTEALRVAVQIAEALEAAHRRGLIHRDLKPGNIMLGPGGLVKVLDFGLAKSTKWRSSDVVAMPSETTIVTRPAIPSPHPSAVDEHAPTSPAAGSSGSSGTPGYMSPEQVRAEAQDERTDVFAFGCVLYECLAGKRAFTGASHRDVMVAVLEQSPDLERVPARTPGRVRELLVRCVEKDPAQRPQSMREVRIEIEEALGIRRASALLSGETVAAVPNNLPPQPTSFVGRERAIEQCMELHRSARLLTVTGVGGSGKTRLALRLAESLMPERPDGVWLVDLAPLTDPERVPQATASAIGVREEPGIPIGETLARSLADKRVLLVLDNCEHLLKPCAKLVEELLAAAAELRVVTTSREALGVRGEQVYSVPSLSLPGTHEATASEVGTSESVRLFADRASLAARDFALTQDNAAVVAEICRRLDGIPLAIELAAARVRMLSVDQIRAKLHDRFRLLAGGSRAALPRHQTLRATIQWSYDHLGPDEQQFLRALSVFIGGWTLDAAVAVCANGRDEFEVLDLLTRVEEKSLMVVERAEVSEPRYRFLETVRQYGRDLLIDSGESDAVCRSHAQWFLAFAERAARELQGPDQVSWLDRLETEIDNLRAALEWWLDQEDEAESALRMTAAVQWLWVIRGYLQEGRERLEAAIVRAGQASPTPALAAVLHGAGNACFRLDDYAAARGYYERALEVREQLGDRRGVAGSLGSLGNVAQYQGRYSEAMGLFERSLSINREVGYRVWEAANLNCLGNCSRHLQDFAASRAYLEQSVALNREIGNRGGECTSLDGLGCLMLQLEDLRAARALFEQALAIEREIGNVHDEGVTLSNMGRVVAREGDVSRARAHLADAIRLMRRLGARLQIAPNLEELAKLAARGGQPDRAVRVWAAAHALRDAIGAPIEPAEREHYERGVAAARAAMDAAAFEAAWQRGIRMRLDEAIEDALACGT